MLLAKKLLIFLSIVFLIFLVWFFYPKNIVIGYMDGACFSDRCLGLLEGECLSRPSRKNLCYKTCYGYAYNKCDNRYRPIKLLKSLLNPFYQNPPILRFENSSRRINFIQRIIPASKSGGMDFWAVF